MASLEEKRFLIVDESAHGDLLEVTLSRLGVVRDHIERVNTVDDARARLQDAARGTPDIVALNLDVGKNDGIVFVQGEDRENIPVIVISAYQDDVVEKQVKEAPNTQYLEMPYDRDQLIASLTNALNIDM